MKHNIYSLLPFPILIVFIAYWAFQIIFTIPLVETKDLSFIQDSRFKKTLINPWKFFTPVSTHNFRLYYISRQKHGVKVIDTIEVLQTLYTQKQTKAPFNEKESIIDYILADNLKHLLGIIRKKGIQPNELLPENVNLNSKTKSRIIAELEQDDNFRLHLNNLNNYCKLLLKEKNQPVEGIEVKLIIRQQAIRPFDENRNLPFIGNETTLFESTFNSL